MTLSITQTEIPKYEITNIPMLTIRHKLGYINTKDIAVLLVSPPSVIADVKMLSDSDHLYKIQQSDEMEDLEDFWINLVDNFSIFLDFTATCLKDKRTPIFVHLEQERITNTYALGYLILIGLSERAAIAVMIEKDRTVEFDYYTVCLLDQLMCLDNKLVQVISEYETTGIVVTPSGVTYTKE